MFVLTSHVSWTFYEGQVGFLFSNGFNVEVVSGPGPMLEAMAAEGAKTWAIPMEREIAPFKDFVALCRLWWLFHRRRPDLVIVGTPKAGLLGTIAARVAGVRQIVYMMHGLRLETASGWKRPILWTTEWISCHISHHVRCVSFSLRERVIGLHLVSPNRCSVTAHGSVNGIDVDRFLCSRMGRSAGVVMRRKLGIRAEAPVIGFVGRMTRDKGISELYGAYCHLRQVYPELRLLLVGEFEEGDPVSADLRANLESDLAVVKTGFVAEVDRYYPLMDVLAFPTHREGLGNVFLEAQAASVPVVGTDATGAVDAFVHGETGIRVPVGSIEALARALDRLLGDKKLRIQMGQAGCKWVQKNFRREVVWNDVLADYRSILEQPRLPGEKSPHRRMKRVLDFTLSTVTLVATSPLWLAAAFAIRVSLGSPILFRQVRPGLNARPFTLLKFRTMTDARAIDGSLLNDERRLTVLGRFLRGSSIDELPQLWNVLRGEMSLVGPRPLLMHYVDRYTPEQARRHEVLPGITGWAQINGRNALSWEQKFALDSWYVDRRSFWLDLKILWLTLVKVAQRDGISPDGESTMQEFLGFSQSKLNSK
jgi:lipopolysaccharide/colanic/teichoic acid biosynthesis glycosyltransferase